MAFWESFNLLVNLVLIVQNLVEVPGNHDVLLLPTSHLLITRNRPVINHPVYSLIGKQK